jgi:hypothetical protein
MRNRHEFTQRVSCKCPYESCGNAFVKTVTVIYITNQRGDVIEHNVY